MSQENTSPAWTERQRRTHLQLEPWKARIDWAHSTDEPLESSFSNVLRTDQSPTLTDESTEAVSAPLELLAYQEPDGQVTYLVSMSDAIDASAHDMVRDGFRGNYTVQSVTARQAALDTVFEKATADAFTTRARPPVTYTTHVPQYPAMDPGQVMVELLQHLRTAQQRVPEVGTWLVQVLASPWADTRTLPSTCDATDMLAVQIRLMLVPTPETDFQSILTYSDAGLTQPPATTKLRFRHFVTRDTMLTDMVAARLQPSSAFVTPAAYTRGVLCPPPRLPSLAHGVPGTASPLEQAPIDALEHLVMPTLPVGVEPAPSGGRFLNLALLGLSGPAGSALTVAAEPQELQATAAVDIHAHSLASGPIFAISTVPSVLERYGHMYTVLQADAAPGPTVPTGEIEYVGGDRIETLVETPDDLSFFTSRLGDEPSVTLLDVSQLEAPAAGVTTLLPQLTQAGAAVSGSQSGSSPVGSVVCAAPWPLAPTTAARTRLETALHRVDDASLLVTLRTLFPEVEPGTLVTDWDRYDPAQRQSAYDYLSRLAQATDLCLLQNKGPVSRLSSSDRLPTGAGPSPRTLAEQYGTDTWTTYAWPQSSRDAPVTVPLARLTSTNRFTRTIPTDTGTEYTLPTRDDATSDTSQTATTASQGDRDASDDAVATSTDTTSDTVTIGRRHAPRTNTDLPVEYDQGRDGYVCQECRADPEVDEPIYDRSTDGLLDAIACCHSVADVERDAVRHVPEPVISGASLADITDELSEDEARFLAVLYVLQTGRFDYAVEYDPVVDSGVDIRDDVGISYQTETRLDDDGYIVRTNSPSKLYSLTDRGLEAIGQADAQDDEQFRSMFDRRLRRTVELYMTDQYADTPAQVQTELPYDVATTDSSDPSRATLDVAVQRDDGTLVAGCGLYLPETEAAPTDETADTATETAYDDDTVITYQTLTAANPDTAQWVTWTQGDAIALVNELAAAADAGRVTFSASGDKDPDTARVQYLNCDEPGLTDVNTISHCLDAIDPEWIGSDGTFELQFGGETDE